MGGPFGSKSTDKTALFLNDQLRLDGIIRADRGVHQSQHVRTVWQFRYGNNKGF